MATIKAYTDIEKSKKLAEILPIESADFYWKKELKFNIYSDDYPLKESDFEHVLTFRGNNIIMKNFDIPCWSLSALLDYLSVNQGVIVKSYDNQWEVDCIVHIVHKEYSKELVDACVGMIIKLHEQNLI